MVEFPDFAKRCPPKTEVKPGRASLNTPHLESMKRGSHRGYYLVSIRLISSLGSPCSRLQFYPGESTWNAVNALR